MEIRKPKEHVKYWRQINTPGGKLSRLLLELRQKSRV